jgi:D-aminopeptidase
MSNCVSEQRPRPRELGIAPGILPTGPMNAITDVPGVRVGHFTLIQGDDIRTGATAILAHGGNLFQDKVPAGIAVGNGYGKLVGYTQILELGEIETPIVLTNTLAVPQAADALIEWTLSQPGNEAVTSVNPVVGETNDGRLNNIRKRLPRAETILRAITTATSGPVEEGVTGAGTGTIAFGWKGGIGTSSRALPPHLGGYVVGILVQSNFGGILQILGLPVGQALGYDYLRDWAEPDHANGSIMIVVATDAPLSSRNLTRLARRGLAGLARTGASMSNQSGDYVLAFSSAEPVRRTPDRRNRATSILELGNERMSPLFQATIEACEEAIYNSLFAARTVTGYGGFTAEALPLDPVIDLLQRHTGPHCHG